MQVKKHIYVRPDATTVPCTCRYANDFEKAVLANANVGGENCHRGSAIGALVGASVGEKNIPRALIDGLHDSKAIDIEITAFVNSISHASSACAP